jgi:indole-3-glycerol phosphate synthase
VHTSDELRRALNAGAKIIGVNNRDLQTLEVSPSTSEQLIAEAPQDSVMISESGLRDPEQLRCLRALGFQGFLIGERLMRAKNPETALRDLLAAANDQQIVSLEKSRI